MTKVKEERFCDVTFTFPDSTASGQGQVVKAQKNALIANSPVFEVNVVVTNVAGTNLFGARPNLRGVSLMHPPSLSRLRTQSPST